MACECGAYKVYKAQLGAREHSDWCQWSPCYGDYLARKSPDTKCCNSWPDGSNQWSRDFCQKPGTGWVIYSAVNRQKYYFCDTCWSEIVAPNMGVVLEWGTDV